MRLFPTRRSAARRNGVAVLHGRRFTLAGYAMLIAFGDERFKALLTAPSAEHPASAFMAINATFMHFLVVQIVALLVAIVAKSRPFSSFDEIFHVGPAFASYYTARPAIVYAGWF